MSDYEGKICPFCKTAFKPDDEIVICSECNMPHHRDCWIENQGCTTFGCQGTIQSPGSTNGQVAEQEFNCREEQEVGDIIFCTRCGAQNAGISSFCSKCGNRLTSAHSTHAPVYQQSNPANVNPYSYVNQSAAPYQMNDYANSAFTESELQQLVGTNAEYYMPKFGDMNTQNKKTSWNWAAFLITPYWLIYRRMYAYGAGALGILFLLSFFGTVFGSFLALCGYAVMGIYGNYVYMRFLKNKMEQVYSMNEPYRTQFIAKNRGVNTTAAVLSAVWYAVLMVIISL
jgi:hypothetical protein